MSKVLFFYSVDLNSKKVGGGGVRYINNLISGFKKFNKDNVEIVLCGVSNSNTQKTNKKGIAIAKKQGFVYGLAMLFESLKTDAKVFHINRYYHLIPLLPSVIFKKKKIVFSFHSNIPGSMFSGRKDLFSKINYYFLRYFFKYFSRLMIRYIDKFIYVSSSLRDHYFNKYHSFKKHQLGNPDSHIVIKTPIKKNRKIIGKKFSPKFQNLLEKSFTISMVGRLHPIKNHLLVLKTVKINQDIYRKNRFIFAFAGEGLYKKKIKEFITKENLDDLIFVLNHLHDDQLKTLYENTNCTLITSFSEGGPIVFYESILNQVPVLTTKVGDIPEIMKKNNFGRIIDKYTAENLNSVLIDEFNYKTILDPLEVDKIISEKSVSVQSKKHYDIYENLF